MYSALWRFLPGGPALKIIQLLVLLIVVVLVLFDWVFPWLAETFLVEDSTVE